MPSPFYVTVAQGQQVSSAFFLDRADRMTAIYVGSHQGIGVRLEFATSSADTAFGPVVVAGVTQTFSMDRAMWGIWKATPTPWARVWVSSQMTTTTSMMIVNR
jgi:hypothetical protein